MPVQVGDPAPPFELYNQDREKVSSEGLQGAKSLVVFIPNPFTATCDEEACALRDGIQRLAELDARVMVITAHALPTNKAWSDTNGFEFDVLSDFWPHGAVSSAYGAFNERLGIANRVTYVMDEDSIVRSIIASDSLRNAREFDAYTAALAAI